MIYKVLAFHAHVFECIMVEVKLPFNYIVYNLKLISQGMAPFRRAKYTGRRPSTKDQFLKYNFAGKPQELCNTAITVLRQKIYRSTGGTHYWLSRVVFWETEIYQFDAWAIAFILEHKVFWLNITTSFASYFLELQTAIITYRWLIWFEWRYLRAAKSCFIIFAASISFKCLFWMI
jgi:hypothetical protein